MRRRHPTLRQLDELQDKLALEKENSDHFRKMWVLLEGVRGRYNDVLCREVLKRAKNPKGGLELDDVDYAVVVGSSEAVKSRYRTVDLDDGSLGRGSGPIYHVLRVGKMTYPIVRRPS